MKWNNKFPCKINFNLISYFKYLSQYLILLSTSSQLSEWSWDLVETEIDVSASYNKLMISRCPSVVRVVPYVHKKIEPMKLRKNLLHILYSALHTTRLSLNSIWSSILTCRPLSIFLLSCLNRAPRRCPRELFAVDNMSYLYRYLNCITSEQDLVASYQTNVWIFNSTLNLALGKQRGD